MSGSSGTKISAALDAGSLLSTDMLPLARSGNTSAFHATIAEISAYCSATISTGVSSWNTRTGPVTLTTADITAAYGAPIASPAFTGIPTAPTALAGTSTGQLATTQFVTSAVTGATAGVASWNTRTGAVVMTLSDVTGVGGAPLASPALSGTPTAPTAAPATNNTQVATTAFVATSFAPLASPALSGTPTAPTVTPATDSSTKVATTAFVQSAMGAAGVGVSSWNTRAGAVTLLAADVTGVGGALLASPAFTGTPTVPTAAVGTNTTQAASTAYVTAAVAADPALGGVGRNLVHNPIMTVAQRGAGAFTANGYTLDRWFLGIASDTVSVTQGVFADADRAAIGDEAAQFSLRNAFTGNAAAGAVNYVDQRIEKVNRLSNKTVILSFWAWASAATLKIGVNIIQLFGTGGSPSATVVALATGAAVTLANAWQRYTVTIPIPSVSGKTLGTNGDDYHALRFYYSSGATLNQVAGNIGVQAGTISLYGVQLEIAQPGQTQPTPLDRGGTPQQQLAECQRFYQTGYAAAVGYTAAGFFTGYYCNLPVVMRASPTVALTATVGTDTNVASAATDSPAPVGFRYYLGATATGYVAGTRSFTASADL